MGIFNRFPWSDEHQLNLDWILRMLTSFKGGAANQVLAKKSNKDYDFKWVNQGGGGGGTSDYNDLSNKPSINGVELAGNQTAAQLGLGTYSKPASGIPASDLASAVQASLGKANTALQSVPSTYRTAAAQDTIDEGKLGIAQGTGNAGKFVVVGSNGDLTLVTLSTWQGGSY